MKSKLAALLISLVVAVAVLSPALAQEKKNTDAMFQQARKLAFSGKRVEASALCDEILAACPDCHDARILLGRIHAWNREYPAAREEFGKVLAAKPEYHDARLALIDVELWAGNPAKALEIARQGLALDPKYEEYIYKKAVALNRLGDNAASKAALRELLAINPNHEAALKMLKGYPPAQRGWQVGFSHTNETFSNTFTPWRTTTLEISRQSARGPLIVRFNRASRFGDEGLQTEIETYPKLDGRAYAYLACAFSTDDIFPATRCGADVTAVLPAGVEASAGARHIRFSGATADVYTASVSKYFRKCMLGYRWFYSPKDIGGSNTHIVSIRRYFRSSDDYLTLRLGSGRSPDLNSYSLAIYNLESEAVALDFSKRISDLMLISGEIGVDSDETAPGATRNKTTTKLGIKLRY